MADKLAIHGGTPVLQAEWPRWPQWDENEQKALLECLQGEKWAIDSPVVAEFEKRFAEFHEARHGISVTSCTTGLVVALIGAGIQAGDEVIIPDYTFMATATAVLAAGAVPIIADIDPDTYNLSIASARVRLSPRTRAIVPVHFAGMPADMDAVSAFAKENNLSVVEDAAQAHGASWRGRKVGALGSAGVFSFQSSKNMTSGEGGIIVSNDEAVAETCASYRNCGRLKRGEWYKHYLPGMNYRMTGFQAGILLAQLSRLPEQFRRREENGRYLSEQLSHIPGIRPTRTPAGVTGHAYHLYMFRYDPAEFGGHPKGRFIQALQAEGVPASPGYLLPLHEQAFLNDPEWMKRTLGGNLDPKRADYRSMACPNSEKAVREEAVWLSQRVLLADRSRMDGIAEAVAKVQRNAAAMGVDAGVGTR